MNVIYTNCSYPQLFLILLLFLSTPPLGHTNLFLMLPVCLIYLTRTICVTISLKLSAELSSGYLTEDYDSPPQESTNSQ